MMVSESLRIGNGKCPITSDDFGTVKPLLVSHVGASLADPIYSMALQELIVQGRRLHLDIGAGTGENVVYATSLGFESIGLEYDPCYARCIVGTVVLGSGVSLPFRSGTFDVVSLSHVPRYIDTLIEIKRIIRPGAYLIVEVPGKYTLQELLNYIYGHCVLKKDNKHLGHCNFFTYKYLKRHLVASGFMVLDHKIWGGLIRGTFSSLVSLSLSFVLKVLLHQRRCDCTDNQRIDAIHRRLSSIYNVLSKVDQVITRKTHVFIEVFGFVCKAI